jgi:response regulator RpfG family c-di-GMP phosphodiesterase
LRIVPVSRLAAGMRLARSIYSARGGAVYPLLNEGAKLGPEMMEPLRRAGVFAVYVDDRLSEGIAPAEHLSPQVREEAVQSLAAAFRAAGTGRVARVPAEHLERLGRLVAAIIEEVKTFQGAIVSLADLQGMGARLLEHSLSVCVLGLVLGGEVLGEQGWRDFRGDTRYTHVDERLEKLGLGLLLHDVGLVVVPQGIAASEGPLDDAAEELLRQHPEAGIEMLREGGLSALSRVVVADHHERVDGAGYPRGKSGETLHQHARIAAVADVYDAACAGMEGFPRSPTHEAYEVVMALSGRALDEDLVRAFMRVVAPYPEGVAVVLSDGTRGLVAANHRTHSTRPTVRITHSPDGRPVAPRDVDLIDEPSLTIARALDDPGDPESPFAKPILNTPARGLAHGAHGGLRPALEVA